MQAESKNIGVHQATVSRLDKHRRSIDEIDATLLDLINKRLSQAKEIGKIKENHRARYAIMSAKVKFWSDSWP